MEIKLHMSSHLLLQSSYNHLLKFICQPFSSGFGFGIDEIKLDNDDNQERENEFWIKTARIDTARGRPTGSAEMCLRRSVGPHEKLDRQKKLALPPLASLASRHASSSRRLGAAAPPSGRRQLKKGSPKPPATTTQGFDFRVRMPRAGNGGGGSPDSF